ncbi:MAG: SpvB/TcaC N-terminal domain-containing protein, partial [Kofleriaceae bacterium]
MSGAGGRSINDLSVGHAVSVDARTGAAGLRVPIPCPTGRGGAGPQLALTYSSSAGSTAFGLGWTLAGLPAISIDTHKRLPRWDGTDKFQLGGDELVPWLEGGGGSPTPRTFEIGNHRIQIFRVRMGGSGVRIEQWTHALTGRIHFRTRDAQNAITIFGARAGTTTRIADPEDESRTFAWLPEVRIDARGNAIWLDYAAEDARGIDRASPAEGGRTASAQRYLKRIRYANAEPLVLDDELASGTLDERLRWCFQLVFDYGDHAPDPAVAADRAWLARPDATSTYRAGFDVRTHRLCRRILTFHHFDELGASPVLVNELRLEHELDPAGSVLRSIREVGHRVDGATRTSAELPPLAMVYAPPAATGAFTPVPAESTANVPAGLLGQRYAFVDLFGEGLPGILAETEGAWYWKPNIGDGRFGAQAVLSEKPAVRRGAAGLGDHDRDGDTDLAQLTGRFAGAFELDREAGVWQEFRPLSTVPHVEALGGRAQWADLNGDGRADLVIAQADRFLWFPSGDEGFEAPVEVPKPPGVPATLEDAALDFYFADMNGDGLPDLVRVQNGRIEYWPNLGNGRFADGVVMDDAPWISTEREIDPSRLRFVDLDGSGTTDLLYLGEGEIRAWINAGGNRFVDGPHLRGLPYLDGASSVRIVDLLGDGRPCLVWSSPLPGAEAPLQYLPLVPEVRPRLLLSVEDSLGLETRLVWGHSSRHYRRDVAAGRGWSTKLPMHVSVVDRIETHDRIGGTSDVRRYEYRDGFYDGDEREWRGFGQVDLFDADTSDGGPAPGEPGFAAPTLTRTWFHLGTEMWNHRRPVDAYDADPQLPRLPTHVCDDSLAGALPSELDDALRALAGREIRSEVYAIDAEGRRGDHPFVVTQQCARVRQVQPAHRAYAAGFSVVEHESITATYDQVAGDPRVEGRIIVATDELDQPTCDAAIAYARRAGRPREADAQDRTSITIHDFTLRNFDLPERFELGVPLESRDLELSLPAADLARVTRERLRAPDVAAALAAPAPHHTALGAGLGARLLSWDRSYYWNDDATAALAFGEVGALVRVHHEESAVFAPGFVADVYGARVDSTRLTAAGYTLRDGLWWQSDDVHLFGPAARFYQREGMAHRDGTVTRMTLDAYALEQIATVDPSGNQTTTEIDYCAIAPRRVTDANGAVAETLYDALGVAVVSTARGAVAGQPWGMELLASYTTRSAPSTAQQVLADPAHYLQGAGQFTYYDLGAWQREGAPITVVQLSAEELRADGAGGGTSAGRIAVGVSYLDGFGRVLQEKHLVDAGDAIARDTSGGVVVDAGGHPVLAPADPRWRCSGHVTYDRKQRPVRTHEPFHTGAWAYEGDAVLAQLGVATIELYDAVGRSVRRELPNGTFERTTYGPWRVERADANDTVFESTYRLLRESRPVDDPERQAYEHALAHRDTTSAAVLDPR